VDEDVAWSWRDTLLPAALVLLGAFELLTLRPAAWQGALVMDAVASAFLVARRTHPFAASTLSVAALVVTSWFGTPLNEPATPIMYLAVAAYTLSCRLPLRRACLGLAVIFALLFSQYLAFDVRDNNWTDVVFVLSLAVPPFVVGNLARRLAEQGRLLKENQELVRRQAVRDERDRIARELHDVIAHSVSAMVVQTAAAQELVRRDPDRAQQVLADVADTGRRALVETGRLLHVIRDEADELGLTPAPGAREVPALVQAFRESGLDVDLELQEALPPLPPGVDVSVYRIVQEALTNALKHGAGRTASVRLSTTPTDVSVLATNPAGNASGGGSGLGLVGMAERVALLGGRLTHGVEGDRFRLTATLPLDRGQG
jgi:signal transduction histidine kinase